MHIVNKSIPDQSYPRLPTTTSGAAQQGTCGNYATAELVKKQQKDRRKASEEAAGSVKKKTLTH